jgi:hypothetical protein
MKLYCFVILVFILVILVGEEREWRIGGIKGVNALNTNQNKANLNQPLARSLNITNKQLSQEEPEQESKTPTSKYPSPTQHSKPIDENDKGKHGETNNGDAQHQNVDNDKETAKKLEEEAQTINKVIVVLCSLGASLLLVAIAIAVLYLKVRRQQQFAKAEKIRISNSKGENTGGNTNDNDDNSNSNNNNNGNGKRDDGGGVGNDETSDDSSIFITPLGEKPNIINGSNSSGGVNNGVGIGVVGDKDEVPCIPYKQFHNIPQLSPPVQPSAPSAEKLIEEVDNMDNNISNSSLSFPHLTAPPAYTPTAPPIYALPHSPIPELPEFDGSTIMYMNRNYQQNHHYLETNNNDGNNGEDFVRMSPSFALPPSNTGVWTSQTNIPIDNTPIDNTSYQQSNDSTIIHPSSTMSPTSSNSHENNNDNRSTHQRHNSSTI